MQMMMAPERQDVTSVSAIVAASVRPLRQLRPERKLFALGRAENHLSVRLGPGIRATGKNSQLSEIA